MYQTINREIEKFQLPKPVLVSWLSKEANKRGKEESTADVVACISSINDPLKMTETNYREVKPNYFGGLSHGQSAKLAEEIENIVEKLKQPKKLNGFQ